MKLYVIPTNRLVLRAAESLCKEILAFKNKQNTILIVDNSVSEIYLKNVQDMGILSQKYGIPIYITGLEHQKKLINEISRKLKYDNLIELLYPYGVDYGKIFNMIYLYTVLLGEDSFHRRDSDCLVDLIENVEHYPINKENQLLGKKISEVEQALNIIEEPLFDRQEEILIVGSDYFGDWNLDLSDIISENEEALFEFFDLMNIPRDAIREQIKDKYSGVNLNRLNKPILKTSFNVTQYPDCGNVSMQKVFKFIPNFIGNYGIGFDYHTYFLGFLIKIPIVYHENKIEHRHDQTRKSKGNVESLKNYWKGIIKQVDIDVLYTYFIKNELDNFFNKNIGYSGMKLLERVYDKELPDILQKCVDNLKYGERLSNIQRVIDNILLKCTDKKYKIVAEYLQTNMHEIICEMNEDYNRSILLQRKWKAIIAITKSLQEQADKFYIDLSK